MKTLPTNHALIAAFVNQSLTEARNPRDSVWFNHNKLYSYQSHLATLTPDRVLFINADLISYSVTTSAHISSLRGIAEDLQTFTVPLDLTPIESLEWYWTAVRKSIGKYLRSRAVSSKHYHKFHIIDTIHDIESYVDYMQIDKLSLAYMEKHDITKLLFKHQIL